MRNEGKVKDSWKPKSLRIAAGVALLAFHYPYESVLEWSLTLLLLGAIVYDIINVRSFEWNEEGFILRNKLSKDSTFKWDEVSVINDDQIEYHIHLKKLVTTIKKASASKELIDKLDTEMKNRANKALQTTSASARV